jgi:ATP-dependent 26S proteasome regulatory subunit
VKLLQFLTGLDGSGLEDSIAAVALRTEGMTGADLTAICDEARMAALREAKFARHASVQAQHLEQAAVQHLTHRFKATGETTLTQSRTDDR